MDKKGNSDVTETATAIPPSPSVASPQAVDASGPLPLVEVPIEYYVLEGEQGRGGIGIVMRARDRRTDRVVALKQLQSLAPEARLRFEREMRITARLQHPGVVPVHETGRFGTGEPFYAMKLVQGRSLKEVISEKTTLEERLALLPHVLAVAETIAYAHSQRVIHRDLKPSNVIVGAYGETVVIDWGLAKDLDAPADAWIPDGGPFRAAHGDELTLAGQVLGTPAYMPPEQARGGEIDERADVYAIGAILYHLLAGAPPYRGSTSAEILTALSKGPPLPIADHLLGVPADLAAVVQKAMDRDPQNRYPTAASLAEDLKRFQVGQLVSARQYDRQDLLARWIGRHLRILGAAAGGLVLLLGIAGFSLQAIIASKRKTDAAESAARREAGERLLAQAESLVATDPAKALALIKDKPRGDSSVAHRYDWIENDALAKYPALQTFRAHSRSISALALSRDGKRLFALAPGESVTAWDTTTGQQLARFPLGIGPDTRATQLAFLTAEDADEIGFVSSPSAVVLVDTRTLETHEVHRCAEPIAFAVLNRDGSRLACVDHRAHVTVVNTEGGRLSSEPMLKIDEDSYVWVMDFSRDGNTVYLGLNDGAIDGCDSSGLCRRSARRSGARPMYLRARALERGTIVSYSDGSVFELSDDFSTVSLLGEQHGGGYNPVVSDDGRYVALTHSQTATRILDRTQRRQVVDPNWTNNSSYSEFDSTGEVVFVGYSTGFIRVWNHVTGQIWILTGHSAPIEAEAVARSADIFASADSDGYVRIWHQRPKVSQVVPLRASGVVAGVAAGANGVVFTSAVNGDVLIAWRPPELKAIAATEIGDIPDAIAASTAASFVVASTTRGVLRLFELRGGALERVGEIQIPFRPASLSMSPRGNVIIADSGYGIAIMLAKDLGSADWKKTRIPLGSGAILSSFSDDEGVVALTSSDGLVQLWKTGSGQLLLDLKGTGAGWVYRAGPNLYFVAQGARLVAVDGKGAVLFTLSLPLQRIVSVASWGPSPLDAVAAVTCVDSDEVSIVSPSTWRRLATIRGCGRPLSGQNIAWSRSGVAVLCTNGLVRYVSLDGTRAASVSLVRPVDGIGLIDRGQLFTWHPQGLQFVDVPE